MNSTTNTLVFDLGNTLYPSSLQHQAMKKSIDLHDIGNIDIWQQFELLSPRFPLLGGTLNLQFVSAMLKNINSLSNVDAITLLADYRHFLYILIKEYILGDPYETWKFLKDLSTNYNMGILSDNSVDTKNMWLELLMDTDNDFFDFFIVSEEVGVSKPNLQMFFSIKQHIDPTPEFDDIIFFGDNLIRDGASAFHSMTFIHVNSLVKPPTQTRQPFQPNEMHTSIDFINNETMGLLMLTHINSNLNQPKIIES